MEVNVYTSDIIIVGSDCYPEIADLLPVHSIIRNGTIETEEVTANRMQYTKLDKVRNFTIQS